MSAAWIWLTLPRGIRPAALSREAWGRVFGSPVLMGVVAVTALQGAGQFVLFSYFAPVLKQKLHADATTLSLMWGWFGACGLAGNMLVSRYIDRFGAARMVLLTTSLIALSLLSVAPGRHAGDLARAGAGRPGAWAAFATNSAQQARLVGLAPALAPGSVALNSSGIYIGQADRRGGRRLAAGPRRHRMDELGRAGDRALGHRAERWQSTGRQRRAPASQRLMIAGAISASVSGSNKLEIDHMGVGGRRRRRLRRLHRRRQGLVGGPVEFGEIQVEAAGFGARPGGDRSARRLSATGRDPEPAPVSAAGHASMPP